MCKSMGKLMTASLTLEAAVVLPLYLFFFLALLSVMEMMQFSMTMDHHLSRISKQIALYASADSLLEKSNAAAAQQEQTAQDTANGGSAAAEKVEGVAVTVLADLYVDRTLSERIPQGYRSQMGVQGDVELWRSNVLLKDDLVDLVATYEMQPRCNVFGIPDQLLVNRARTHAWTGYRIGGAAEETEEKEQMVYVTETGTVYHLSRSCTHLDLAISPVASGQLAASRNASGGTYQMCEMCGMHAASQGTFYITKEGDRYHSSLQCSGLKRTVYEIPISEVGDRRPCSRCSR